MNPLEQAVYHAAEGGGPSMTFAVPEGAVIRPGTGPSVWAGMVIASWCED